MAITINDIQEKAFSTQLNNGYNRDEVDDYFDEIVEELRGLISENVQLRRKVTELEEALNSKETELQDAIRRTPDYNEEGYMRDLQSALRETLLASRRIASETETNARTEAEKTINDAQTEAARILSEATAQAETVANEANAAASAAREEYESLKHAASEYRDNFRKLVESQIEVLNANDLLFQ